MIDKCGNKLIGSDAGYPDPSNIVTVGKGGSDYTTIKDALASITDNSLTNQYAIQVAPGVYIEDNPLQCKEYVSIRGSGGSFVTSVVAQNANQNMFDMSAFCVIRGLNINSVSGSGYAFSFTTPGISSIVDCINYECSNGILLNNASASLNISNHGEFNTVVTSTRSIHVLAGNLTVTNYTVAATSIVTTIATISGASSIATLIGIISFSPNVGTALLIQDQARIVNNISSFVGMTDGIVAEGGSVLQINTINLFNAQQDGLRINDVGSNTEVNITGIIEDSTRYDLNVLSSTALLTGSGRTSIDKLNFVPGAQLIGAIIDNKEDDEGFNIIGELHVGIPEAGFEAVMGEGDSYTRGMLVYTESSGGVFTDVSIEARSASLSSFTFPGVDANNAIYVASSLTNGIDVLEHYGIKTKVETAAVLGAGEIVIEYWNGSTWIELNGMEVDSDEQYYPHAKNYFQDTGGHHIRYNNQLVTDTWTKNDPINPSIGINYYWIRFRIVTAITTAPVFQQFKLHTNRYEVNADGWVEYFGKARPIGQLPFAVGGDRAFAGTVQNQSIWINQNLGAGLIENRFINTLGYIGRYFFIPFDLDTSCPIELIFAGRPSATTTIEFTVEWEHVTEGNVAYISNPVSTLGKQSQSVSQATTATQIIFYKFLLDVSNIVSRRENSQPDFVCLSIHPSVITGTFDLMSLEATYTKWCEGGHI